MTTLLGRMIKTPRLIYSPGIHYPPPARIAQWVGFWFVGFGRNGRGILTCQIGSEMSFDDLAKTHRDITQVIGIPLLVDAGGGFGEPAHVFHTVRVLEHAGAAGVFIDDQLFPKRFHYYMDGRVETIPYQEMIEKIRYAVQARRDRDFVVGYRTDPISPHGFARGCHSATL